MTFQINTSITRVVVCPIVGPQALYDEAKNYGLTGLEPYWFPVINMAGLGTALELNPAVTVWCATPGVDDRWARQTFPYLRDVFGAQKTFAEALNMVTDEIAIHPKRLMT